MQQLSESGKKMRCSVVIDECEDQFGFSRGALRRKSKQRDLEQARHVAAHLCRKITGRSYMQIAIALGYKDHTTVLYACRKTAPILLRDPEWAAKAKSVEGALGD